MAILIKGMEMPDSCFLCRFCRRQEYGEYVGEDTAWSCVASKKRITDGQDLIATFKHPNCPLVEVAEVPDAVCRQAVIDIVDFECGKWRGLARTIAEAIEHLPSAQLSCNKLQQVATDCIIRQAAIDASVQPEIIRCKDCKWYGRADKRRFYRGMDCLQKRIDTIVPDKDFCSKAERRTDEQT